VISAIQVELRALRDNSPGMDMLTAVEYVTADSGHRVALFRRCSAQDRSVYDMGQDDSRLLKIASSIAKDLGLIECRAMAEGLRFRELWPGPGKVQDRFPVTCPMAH
jgi:hypothetical protein